MLEFSGIKNIDELIIKYAALPKNLKELYDKLNDSLRKKFDYTDTHKQPISEEFFLSLMSTEPNYTPTSLEDKMGRYSMWLAKLYYADYNDVNTYLANGTLKNLLEQFSRIGRNLPKPDLFTYKNIVDLDTAIGQYHKELKRYNTYNEDKSIENLYEDDKWLLQIPLNHAGAIEVAKLEGEHFNNDIDKTPMLKAKWCTSDDNKWSLDQYNTWKPLLVITYKPTGEKWETDQKSGWFSNILNISIDRQLDEWYFKYKPSTEILRLIYPLSKFEELNPDKEYEFQIIEMTRKKDIEGLRKMKDKVFPKKAVDTLLKGNLDIYKDKDFVFEFLSLIKDTNQPGVQDILIQFIKASGKDETAFTETAKQIIENYLDPVKADSDLLYQAMRYENTEIVRTLVNNGLSVINSLRSNITDSLNVVSDFMDGIKTEDPELYKIFLKAISKIVGISLTSKKYTFNLNGSDLIDFYVDNRRDSVSSDFIKKIFDGVLDWEPYSYPIKDILGNYTMSPENIATITLYLYQKYPDWNGEEPPIEDMIEEDDNLSSSLSQASNDTIRMATEDKMIKDVKKSMMDGLKTIGFDIVQFNPWDDNGIVVTYDLAGNIETLFNIIEYYGENFDIVKEGANAIIQSYIEYIEYNDNPFDLNEPRYGWNESGSNQDFNEVLQDRLAENLA